MNIDTVMHSGWQTPHETDRIESITQMRNYVIIITSGGRVWRVEDDPRGSERPLFSLVGNVI